MTVGRPLKINLFCGSQAKIWPNFGVWAKKDTAVLRWTFSVQLMKEKFSLLQKQHILVGSVLLNSISMSFELFFFNIK